MNAYTLVNTQSGVELECAWRTTMESAWTDFLGEITLSAYVRMALYRETPTANPAVFARGFNCWYIPQRLPSSAQVPFFLRGMPRGIESYRHQFGTLDGPSFASG